MESVVWCFIGKDEANKAPSVLPQRADEARTWPQGLEVFLLFFFFLQNPKMCQTASLLSVLSISSIYLFFLAQMLL